MSRLFTFGEAWGNMKCEHDSGCNRLTYTIRLTDAENNKLPERYGSLPSNFILANKLGRALCASHIKEIESNDL